MPATCARFMCMSPTWAKSERGRSCTASCFFFLPKKIRSLPSQMKAEDDQQLSRNLFRLQSPSPHVFVDWINKSGPEGGKIGVANSIGFCKFDELIWTVNIYEHLWTLLTTSTALPTLDQSWPHLRGFRSILYKLHDSNYTTYLNSLHDGTRRCETCIVALCEQDPAPKTFETFGVCSCGSCVSMADQLGIKGELGNGSRDAMVAASEPIISWFHHIYAWCLSNLSTIINWSTLWSSRAIIWYGIVTYVTSYTL